MFEDYNKPRETILKPENNAENLEKDIISLLKTHCLSLSQTRTLFHEIIIKIEDSPLKQIL